MAQYRKKPVVIEAVPWQGTLTKEVLDLVTCEFSIGDDGPMFIPTLEGEMRADLGDWIVKGVKGEVYPVKPDIFEATYEAVEV